jgi:arrestin-related trafficking adapter 1
MDNILPKKSHKKDKDDRETRTEKRSSNPFRTTASKSKDRTATKNAPPAPPKPARFDTTIESSPLVMYNSPSSSTGALLSTQIRLFVDDPSGRVTLTSWKRTLRAVSTTKKPVHKDCVGCSERIDVLSEADIISKPTTYLASNENSVPFQYLFSGNLPATTTCSLGAIHYELLIVGVTSEGQEIRYQKPLTLRRAIPEGSIKNSIRIFPPTNLTGRVQLPQVVHPIGQFPVSMTLSGVVEKKETAQTRWRLRKLMWRVEEHSNVTSTPCSKHASKVPDGKALLHSETRTLGADEIKTGWKTDFDTAGGEITLEFDASVATKPSHKPVCDVDSPSGTKVTHNLVLELIVAEEFCSNKTPSMITPTGAARVLRMQFGLVVTERAGMGISWDEEMPPVYEDVPPSPPGYGSADRGDGAWGGAEIIEYTGPALDYPELERIPSADPNGPPIYREREITHLSLDDVPEASTAQARRLGGFTADELEIDHPQFRRRSTQDTTGSNEQDQVDYGEGETAGPH